MPRKLLDLDTLCTSHGLNRSGRAVLEALIADPTLSGRQIARLTGVSTATVCRWLRRPGLRRALVQAGLGSAVAYLPSAVHLLMDRAFKGDTKALLAACRALGLLDPVSSPLGPAERSMEERIAQLRREMMSELDEELERQFHELGT